MWKHFDFVYQTFLNSNDSARGAKSYSAFARYLNLSLGKVQKWRESKQWPKAPDLAVLHDKLGFSYRWLVTGEGDPFNSHAEAIASTPVNGEQEKDVATLRAETNALKDKLLAAHDRAFAVMEENARLHERIHRLNEQLKEAHLGFQEGKHGQDATAEVNACGMDNAVHSLHQGSE